MVVPAWLRPERATRCIKRSLGVPFVMDIIIIMCWSIWVEQNSWIFNGVDPTIQSCKITFKRELAFVLHRTKNSHKEDLRAWLSSLD
jgi:hypothetical protein